LIRPAQSPYDLRTVVRNQEEKFVQAMRAKRSDTIGGLAKAAGVGVETVRYYQRRGLLPEPARPPGEVRRYGDEDVKRLRFIRSAQAAGFTLAEIKELLDLDASDDRARARELARSRVAALDERIAELARARDALAALATACVNKRGGPCPILKAFDAK
jgi:MerR family mercuric resistance operon transcriptional regulator